MTICRRLHSKQVHACLALTTLSLFALYYLHLPTFRHQTARQEFVNVGSSAARAPNTHPRVHSRQVGNETSRTKRPPSPAPRLMMPAPARSRKVILFWTELWGDSDQWKMFFRDLIAGNCPTSTCDIVTNRRFLPTADAVVFHLIDIPRENYTLPLHRPKGQIWILFCIESPAYPLTRDVKIKRLNGVFNWTMTYRWDSTIPVPYGLVLPRQGSMSEAVWRAALPERVQRILPKRPRVRYMSGVPANKTSLVVWMASNCRTPSRRFQYIRKLQKHVQVDIYGRCGTLSCGTSVSVNLQETNANQPCERVIAGYKFYLAFENAFCPDYVTEKFFRTLMLGVVPVVLGGANYTELVPRGSYIDARRYSPRQLAEYLLYLDRNATAYNEFFDWRDSYGVLEAYPMRPLTCGLCSSLHDVTESDVIGSYSALDRWFDPHQCTR